MSIARNIAATYRGPGKVISSILSQGQREDRALAYLMGGCGMFFIAQMPRLARQAHLNGEDLNMLMGGALLGWVIIAPLIFYTLGGLSHIVARIVGGKGSFWTARMALFWAVLASSPLILLHGLVAGFVGPGPQLSIVGIAWCVIFLWFWGRGLWTAEQEAKP